MNPIVPHSNNGRSFLFVGGIPVEATNLDIDESPNGLPSLEYDNTKAGILIGSRHGIELGNYEFLTLLGTIHTEGNALVFSEGFDPEVLVQTYAKMYRDYTSNLNGLAAHCLSKEQSLLSLLESKELLMVNPYGEKEPRLPHEVNWATHAKYKTQLNDWRTSEDKRHKFKVAVIEVK